MAKTGEGPFITGAAAPSFPAWVSPKKPRASSCALDAAVPGRAAAPASGAAASALPPAALLPPAAASGAAAAPFTASSCEKIK